MPSASCYSFACSADGVKWIVGGASGVSLSKDAGATWDNNTNCVLDLVASSADGNIMMGWGLSKGLCVSEDGGVSWTTRTNGGRAPPGFALAMALSADGIRLVATKLLADWGEPDYLHDRDVHQFWGYVATCGFASLGVYLNRIFGRRAQIGRSVCCYGNKRPDLHLNRFRCNLGGERRAWRR